MTMTTAAKLAIAAVIVSALIAVIGYDLMFGRPKNGGTAGDAPAKPEAGLTILPDVRPSANPVDLIGEAERREAGAAAATPSPVGAGEAADADRPSLPIAPPERAPAPAPSNEEYVVQAGETLADIAERKYGDPNKWTVIAKANKNVNPNRMKIGTKLVLPSEAASVAAENVSVDPAPAPAPAPAEGTPRSYTIQAGDVLSKIAKRFYGTAAA